MMEWAATIDLLPHFSALPPLDPAPILSYAQAGETAKEAVVRVADELFGENMDGAAFGLVRFAAYVIGGFFCMFALIKLGRATAQPGAVGQMTPQVASTFIIGTMLIALPWFVDFLVHTAFNDQQHPMSYSGMTSAVPEEISERGEEMVSVGIRIIQFVGLLAIVRGLFILKKHSEGGQQATVGRALTHMIGGMLAMNIVGVSNMMAKSFGYDVPFF